jgi:hypothetical protein
MKKYILFGSIILSMIGLAVFYFWPLKQVVINDHLCNFVRSDQKLECMAILAEENLVAPGSFMEAAPESISDKRVPLPRGNLFGSSCIIPGADGDLIKADLSRRSSISMPTFTYSVNKSLKEGLEIQVPQLEALSMKAGPNFSSVSKIELSTEDAWAVNVNEISAHQALSSCSLKKSCVDYIKSQHYRVVGTSLIAKGISYKFYDTDNRILSLEAATQSEAISISSGGSLDATRTINSTLKSSEPRVIGVRFLPPDFFANQQVCESNVIYTASGFSDVSVAGGGGRGNIGGIARSQKPLGEEAAIERSGSETSECRDSIDRKTSSAYAAASIKQVEDNTLELKYNLAAKGGHYVTVAACAAGQWIGKTGHDTTAFSTASIAGSLSALVRSETGALLTLAYENVPENLAGRLNLSLKDWRGEKVPGAKGEVVDMSQLIGSGKHYFRAPTSGLYRLEINVNIDRTVGGNVDEREAAAARFSLVVN